MHSDNLSLHSSTSGAQQVSSACVTTFPMLTLAARSVLDSSFLLASTMDRPSYVVGCKSSDRPQATLLHRVPVQGNMRAESAAARRSVGIRSASASTCLRLSLHAKRLLPQ